MKGLFLFDDITASKDLSKLISGKNILRVKKSLKSENKQGTAITRDGARWQGDFNCSSLPAGLGRNG